MEPTEPKTSNKKTIIIAGLIIAIISSVLYFQFINQSKEEKEYQTTVLELKQNVQVLQKQLKSIKKEKTIVSFEKDSLKKNLNYLWGYKPLVMTSYLRDRITANFDYKPGDLVRMKTDSSIVIVTDILLGGNDYNYFLKFLIKNKKGESKEVSPLEIEAVNK
jgi:preprotein translocase subunit YajC